MYQEYSITMQKYSWYLNKSVQYQIKEDEIRLRELSEITPLSTPKIAMLGSVFPKIPLQTSFLQQKLFNINGKYV